MFWPPSSKRNTNSGLPTASGKLEKLFFEEAEVVEEDVVVAEPDEPEDVVVADEVDTLARLELAAELAAPEELALEEPLALPPIADALPEAEFFSEDEYLSAYCGD